VSLTWGSSYLHGCRIRTKMADKAFCTTEVSHVPPHPQPIHWKEVVYRKHCFFTNPEKIPRSVQRAVYYQFEPKSIQNGQKFTDRRPSAKEMILTFRYQLSSVGKTGRAFGGPSRGAQIRYSIGRSFLM
jgi:hypothetical protein